MTDEEFELLLIKSEGDTIDFKAEHYDLINSNDDSKAKFVKDIISFTNTIRNESAYIVIGVESIDSKKNLLGLNKHIDEAILQDQLKSRVYPIPQILYKTVFFKAKEYGIIEIPLKRYPEPIAPIVKMKGLEPGKIYIRRGSSNSEAIGKEVILIDKWIKSVKLEHDIQNDIDNIIKQINSGQSRLSFNIASAFEVANQISHDELLRFCKGELTGWYNDTVGLSEDNLPSHRKIDVMVSIYEIQNVTRLSNNKISMKKELRNDSRFREIKFLIQEPVSEIEANISKDNGNGGYVTIRRKMEDIFPDAAGSTGGIFVYADLDDYKDLYERTKTELLRLLISIRT
jgi:hypothetical protein